MDWFILGKLSTCLLIYWPGSTGGPSVGYALRLLVGSKVEAHPRTQTPQSGSATVQQRKRQKGRTDRQTDKLFPMTVIFDYDVTNQQFANYIMFNDLSSLQMLLFQLIFFEK